MIQINVAKTLSFYYNFCKSFNENKSLKDQLRTEVNTGHLLLVLLCNDLVRKKKQGSILYTHVKSISTQSGQCKRTIKNHLRILLKAKVIESCELLKVSHERNKFKVVFNPEIIQYTLKTGVDKVLISEQNLVDNYLKQGYMAPQSEKLQTADNKDITI